MAVIIFYILSLYAAHIAGDEFQKPNIVFIVADDMGWDDISLHGSDQILTPNIDLLGYHGCIIPNYYTDCQGTPSRSAMLTGKYPMKMGTQGPSIGVGEDRGIPVSERLLPSYLKDLGYVTHLVGKWQLGKSRECYLPMNRGFDSFYGFTEGSVDYYTYDHAETINGTDVFGLDFFNNFKPIFDQSGQKHLTNVLTDRVIEIINEHNKSVPLYLHLSHAAPHIGGGMVNLQAAGEDVAANSHIAHSARRMFAGMVTGVDKSLGRIVKALSNNDMLNNTLIIFVSDNGAQSIGALRNYGSNLPLRGTKGTPWEGAVRSTGILWHADIYPKIYEGLFHVTDWLPTLMSAAGSDMDFNHIDGKDQWDSIINDKKPKRDHVIIAVDDLKGWGAFRVGDLKLIVGTVPNTCGYYGQELNKISYSPPNYNNTLLNSQTCKVFTEKLGIGFDIVQALEKRDLCNLNKRSARSNNIALEVKELCVPTKAKGCLFNISADPEESQDLWDEYPDIVLHLTVRFRLFWADLVPRRLPSFDPRANPAHFGFTWNSWLKNDDEQPAPVTEKAVYPMPVSSPEMQYFLDLNMDVLKEQFTSYMYIMGNTLVDSISSLFGSS